MLVEIGRFFFLFGLALFVMGLMTSYIVAASGMEVPEPLQKSTSIFKIAGAASLLSFVGTLGAASFVLKDYLVKPGMLAFYISMVTAAIPGIVGTMNLMLSYLPQQPVWQAIAYFITVLGPASILYYAFNRLGFLPDI